MIMQGGGAVMVHYSILQKYDDYERSRKGMINSRLIERALLEVDLLPPLQPHSPSLLRVIVLDAHGTLTIQLGPAFDI